MIPNQEENHDKVHTNPILCFYPFYLNSTKDTVSSSTNIEEVTCQYCNYYYFHPEARQLELEFRTMRKK